MKWTRSTMALSFLSLIAPLIGWSQCALGQEDESFVVITVRDLSGRSDQGALYLASSANGWDPNDASARLSPAPSTTEDGAPHWSIDLPLAMARASGFEFKITRGSWDTVEVGADGRDIPNRRISADVARAGQDKYEFDIHGFADQRPTRWPALAEGGGESTVVGNLDIFDFTSRIRGNTRKIRVWTPPAYDTLELRDQPYPVLYMHDGQNLFDSATSFIGVEWGVDETLTDLITSGSVPPMIVVGIDNAGEARADEYVPVKIGGRLSGRGGKANEYLRMLTQELMPLINEKYRTLDGPEHTAMGGSSLGGVITLHAAMSHPDMFGAILVESPALGVGGGQFLAQVQAFDDWPERVFMAGGTKEGVFEGGRSTYPQLLRAAEQSMRAHGLDESRLMVVIEEGAEHNEGAWAHRLPEAFRFLFAED